MRRNLFNPADQTAAVWRSNVILDGLLELELMTMSAQ